MTQETDVNESAEITREFLVEADELVAALEANFSQLESSETDHELLNQIFRAAHTIKGIASFLSFDRITTLTHGMEDVFNRMRKGELAVSAALMDTLYLALDTLKQLLDDIRSGQTESKNIAHVLARLHAALADPTHLEQEKKVSEVAAVSSAQSHEPDRQRTAIYDRTIRIDIERLDTIMNLLSELVLSRNMLLQLSVTLIKRLPAGRDGEALANTTRSLDFLVTELQTAVMKTRMQPIGRLFGRFPRLVRDLMRESGKQIDLEMFGAETELDKSMIEEVADPLVHILRNACHHGIETPEERVAQGKSPRGSINLSASQEGAFVLIRVSDDGRGLDTDAILKRVIERKLLPEEEAWKLSESQLAAYILEPGFTTARVVSDISGRGVGMDVVRTNVERLNGQIGISSIRGGGTTITLRIPFTLAIIRGLVIESDSQVFVLPLAAVRAAIRTLPSMVRTTESGASFRWEEEWIPFVPLADYVSESPSSGRFTQNLIVLEAAGKKLALGVTRFVGQEDVVVKPLDDYVQRSDIFAGATILGDGHVRMIIDVHSLIDSVKS